MARRAQPIGHRSGVGAAAIVAALILGALVAVALRAESGRGLGPSDWGAVQFTVVQAALSAGFSVAIAVPVARALARRRFPGRRILIALLGAPFILPVIVAVLGLLAVFGRNGWISVALGWIGLPPLQIYGLHGVVLAHVFFNLPLATRLILQGWQEIPAERFRLAAQLGAGPRAMWQLLEWPMLRQIVPSVLAVIFAICLTSFAVALTLGGGPGATTIELAIYQAFRFDFDLGRAALLSCIQIALTGTAALIALRTARGDGFGSGLDRPVQRWDARGKAARVLDGGLIMLAAGFLLVPLAAIVLAGLPGLVDLPVTVLAATLNSVFVAGISTLVTLALALPMAIAVALGRGGFVEFSGLLGLAASPLVIGTGFFVVIYPVVDPALLALPVTALVNALMALPFALRILVPRARQVIDRYGRLALTLGMAGRPFLRRVLLPRMRAQIGFAAGLSAALSMGDLGVITLFADSERATLPLQVYRLMGAYQMQAAAAAALLLLAMSMALFWLLDRGGRWHAEA
ncbi:thiamine/thiamine pyrophosphate ABC transporter permease ThiP [Sedimentitalea todarodis]|uniref:Thiamine/thiamine pyrophosphate ABC transporter permease ThiP n=1 Tax=Sedimentitalea todarodis TaxID=1631240 RepID=A0ABU3VDC4_9RHOB|nr:thiamine/thiamine pyrophosphate ABC transporter permease ThiP [Sedimentitalea todarodis]MDU9004171.1 thiamine/thiamine pyrophosphate ABC transporter permease ThiP [Sedimentitalea todarodis]